MTLEFEIPIICFIITIFLNIVYFFKQRVYISENNYFEIILVSVLIECGLSSIAHTISAFCSYEILMEKYFTLFVIINRLVSSLFVIIFFCLFLYVLSINKDKLLKKHTGNIIVAIMGFSSLFITHFLNLNIKKVGSVTNVGGGIITFGYVMVLLFMLLSVAYTLLRIRKYDKRYLPVFVMFPVLIGLYIATVVFPGIILYDFGLCMLCLIMYHTIENPDVKMLNKVKLAKTQLEKSEQIKSDFISSMSHEIRTPLNAIVGYSQMIEYSKSLKEAKENAREIVSSSNTLLNMISNVLDISNIESNSVELNNSEYEFKNAVNDVLDLFEYKIEENRIKLKTKIESGPVIKGDINKIKRILANLIDNAVKYTKNGKITIDVAQKINRNKCAIKFTIVDTGCGIPKDIQDHLFENFIRQAEYKDSNISGMGLGLSITKRLLDLMGGKIKCISKENEGTRFIVSLEQEIVK